MRVVVPVGEWVMRGVQDIRRTTSTRRAAGPQGSRARTPARNKRKVHTEAKGAGVTQVGERIWLVTFMHYDLGYFDDETCRLEPIENPFGPKVLPMCSE